MSEEKSKTEYLKRYLENDKHKRKKKPKTSKTHVSRIKILDGNIDVRSILPSNGDEIEEDEDEHPVVAEIIDERPVEVKVKELYDPSRWKRIGSDTESNQEHVQRRHRSDSGSDISPSHKNQLDEHGAPLKTRNRHDSDSDNSPPRIRGSYSDKETNIKSSEQKFNEMDSSSYRRNNSESHKLKRNLNKEPEIHHSENGFSPDRKSLNKKDMKMKSHQHSDSDVSPPRKISRQSDSDVSPPRKASKGSDSDMSPPRKASRRSDRDVSLSRKAARHSDSDISPPRSSSLKNVRKSPINDKNNRPVKTLLGLKAGLQNAATLKQETQELRERERKQITKLDAELSGRNSDTIIRDRRTGKKRDLQEERRVKEEEERKVTEQQQKYSEWGKGIEQTESKKNKLSDDVYETSKPFARYCDDEDLEERLKSIIHDDDPMSEYIKKKRRKEMPSVPEYNGPPPPPNRFGIKPGYRWDGVDRFNGFEKKYLEKLNSTKAVQEEAYLWSVQNM